MRLLELSYDAGNHVIESLLVLEIGQRNGCICGLIIVDSEGKTLLSNEQRNRILGAAKVFEQFPLDTRIQWLHDNIGSFAKSFVCDTTKEKLPLNLVKIESAHEVSK